MKPFPLLRCACCTVALTVALCAAVAEAGTITPVAASASSSFSNRTPDKTIDGSGLSAGLHDNNASNMWLTDINLPSNDPWITYDLGANYDLGSLHVWNYNEYSPANRGIQDVEILTADTHVTPHLDFPGNVHARSGARRRRLRRTDDQLPVRKRPASEVRCCQQLERPHVSGLGPKRLQRRDRAERNPI